MTGTAKNQTRRSPLLPLYPATRYDFRTPMALRYCCLPSLCCATGATPELIGAAIAEAVHFADGRVRVGGYANFWQETERSGWSIEQNETTSGAGNQKSGGMVVRHDLSDDEYACHACGWVGSGASIVGGCCGIRPATMQLVASSLARSRTCRLR